MVAFIYVSERRSRTSSFQPAAHVASEQITLVCLEEGSKTKIWFVGWKSGSQCQHCGSETNAVHIVDKVFQRMHCQWSERADRRKDRGPGKPLARLLLTSIRTPLNGFYHFFRASDRRVWSRSYQEDFVTKKERCLQITPQTSEMVQNVSKGKRRQVLSAVCLTGPALVSRYNPRSSSLNQGDRVRRQTDSILTVFSHMSSSTSGWTSWR
jgi:hypothetical protein